MKRSEMAIPSNALFDRCTETKRMKSGAIQIHCKLGLWSVYGFDHARVQAEARHCFGQYLGDGEYADLLSNPGIDARQVSQPTTEAG